MTTDANGYPLEQFPGARTTRRQQALNESWPLRDDQGLPHARDERDEHGQTKIVYAKHPIPVTVRVKWELDGLEHIAARATRWSRAGSHVFCTWTEPRLPIHGLWVRVDDVERREAD